MLAELHPIEFLYHMQHSIGVFSYTGILNVKYLDVKLFWDWFFKHYNPTKWGQYLNQAINNDTELCDKLDDYVILRRGQELPHKDSLRKVCQSYKPLGFYRKADFYLSKLIGE